MEIFFYKKFEDLQHILKAKNRIRSTKPSNKKRKLLEDMKVTKENYFILKYLLDKCHLHNCYIRSKDANTNNGNISWSS